VPIILGRCDSSTLQEETSTLSRNVGNQIPSTKRRILEERVLHLHCCDNLKTRKYNFSPFMLDLKNYWSYRCSVTEVCVSIVSWE